MDEVIWVEVLSRRRDVAARLRCAGPEVRIGRGYDNDVVIDDPSVAARHVRVFRDEAGQLIAEDCGSVNGMFLDRDRSRRERITLDGNAPIRIGHTLIRVRDGSHAVPAERTGAYGAHTLPIVLVALGAMALGIEVLSAWFSDVGEPRISYYLLRLLRIGATVAVWVGSWMLLSRILSGHANCERNLLIGLVAVIVSSIYNEFAQFTAFSLNWSVPSDYAYVAMWCILAVAFFLSWRVVGPARLALKGAVVAVLLALAVATQSVMQSEAHSEFGRPSGLRRLLPPTFRLAPAREEGAFFSDIELLKAKLDRDRTERPGV